MSEIGKNYAQALYSLAKEESLTGVILEELKTLAAAFAQEPGFLRLLCAPNLSKDDRTGIIDDSFRRHLQPYLCNFLKILTEKGYMRHFGDCCSVYRECYNTDHNILSVTATTAQPMTREQVKRLTAKLSTITGKTVQLANQIDSAVIGGVRLDYDGKRLDDTIANRMDSIRNLLKNTVL